MTGLRGVVYRSPMAHVRRQQSELWFEEYAAERGLEGGDTHQPDLGGPARPDYRVRLDRAGAICEVKEFTTLSLERRLKDVRFASVSSHDQHATVRNKIGKAAKKQLRPYAHLEEALVVVLSNPHDILVPIYEPGDVIEAMYGERGYTFPVDPATGEGGPGNYAYFDGGVFGGGLHSYVSAVVVLHKRDRAADARELWLDQNRHRWADIEDRRDKMAAVLEACRDSSFEEASRVPGRYYVANTFSTVAASTGQAVPLPAGLFDGAQDAMWAMNPMSQCFDLVSRSTPPPR